MQAADPSKASSSSSSLSKKRPAELQNTGSSGKIQKVHPFFTSRANDEIPSPSTLVWTEPLLGPKKTCLHAVNLVPVRRSRVAAFDLDGTLINNGKGQAWEWWRSGVPAKIKEVYEEGYAIVIVTNQAGLKAPLQKKDWKKKVGSIAAKLPDVPFHLLGATARDGYRKPMIGMWRELERILAIPIDKSQSFYVGDAAGRKGDFASTDRKWADNIGIRFYTPEEYFLKLPAVKYDLPGFRPSSLPKYPQFLPSNTPVIAAKQPEIVLFVGYPCLGKTTTFKRYFKPINYVHVNQDTLKTRQKCLKAVEQAIEAGVSCVVDNTNRDVNTRKDYIELGKKMSVPVRCFQFTGSAQLAWHNNLYRAYNLPSSVSASEEPRDILPYSAFVSFTSAYQEPKMEEGFQEIKRVNWVFEGSEEERRHWEMWLQIDGK